mgnify:CR=1 FL=1
MADPAQITALYESYLDTVRTLERNRKPGEGIFGLKGGPADDPCHDRFVDDLTAAIADFAAQEPSSEECRSVLEHMFTVPSAHRELRSAYWMLIAVHGLTPLLIARLSAADAAALYERYGKEYRRWERLPVQKQVLDALKKQAKTAS